MWHRLFDLLFPPREDERVLRTVTPDAFLARITPQYIDNTRPGTTALLPFHDPAVRSAIHEMKYHGNVFARGLLAAALAEYLRESDAGLTEAGLVPIPLGRQRERERGFNQVEEVIRHALRALGPDGSHGYRLYPALLVRARETVSQVSLPRREREANMRDAFTASHPVDPIRTYILIDDVVTTGATLQAAIDALRAGGAVHIIPLALAH